MTELPAHVDAPRHAGIIYGVDSASLRGSLFVTGEHRHTPSLHAALVSGWRAAASDLREST